MILLNVVVETTVARAIGWALIHSLWQGAIISAALGTALISVRSPRVRYATACAAMLLMLIGVFVTFARVLPEVEQNSIQRVEPRFLDASLRDGNTANIRDLSIADFVPWLTPFWIFGVTLIYLRRIASCIYVQRLRHRGVSAAPAVWTRTVSRLASELRISRPVLLVESCLVDVPVVLGHFRPLILMPIGLLSGLPAEQIEAILLHELAHIRRCDYALNILQRFTEGLFFYHPGVWWISRVMRIERENCCDDVAVAVAGNVHDYAVALAALEQHRKSAVEPALAATGGSLVKRIRRLLYPTKPNTAWMPFLAVLVFVTVVGASLAVSQSESGTHRSTAAEMKPAADTNLVYAKWLDEDVVYIIDDAEKAAFQRLATTDERDMFIEQFWARRNPTPGAPRNAFKEEHYRRIAYSNVHFGTRSATAGWRTDRGHVYIVYGPPDEIQTRTNAAQPVQVWFYRHARNTGNGGSISFVDRTGQGDFHLVPGTDAK
jgi:GWxTD domain-containing protein